MMPSTVLRDLPRVRELREVHMQAAPVRAPALREVVHRRAEVVQHGARLLVRPEGVAEDPRTPALRGFGPMLA